MSAVERWTSPPAPTAASAPKSDRLLVITAGRVGDMRAGLHTSGFDVVAVAETEDALIDAVSADEPDAIVVEADLCSSLEHVRDLAPDAVLIVVGDHTPAGALGRIERGVSATVMAGLLRALVAEDVGAAVVWGLVPALRPPAALRLLQHVSGSLTAKAELVRAHVAEVLHDHAGLIAAAGTIAVTASASVLFTLSAPRTHERPDRVPFPEPVVEPSPLRAVIAVSPATRGPTQGLSRNEAGPGDRRRPRPHAPIDPGRRRHGSSSQGSPPPATSQALRPPGVANGWDRRPPKHADNGHRDGWSDNSVPEDLPPGSENHGGREDRGELRRSPTRPSHGVSAGSTRSSGAEDGPPREAA